MLILSCDLVTQTSHSECSASLTLQDHRSGGDHTAADNGHSHPQHHVAGVAGLGRRSGLGICGTGITGLRIGLGVGVVGLRILRLLDTLVSDGAQAAREDEVADEGEFIRLMDLVVQYIGKQSDVHVAGLILEAHHTVVVGLELLHQTVVGQADAALQGILPGRSAPER